MGPVNQRRVQQHSSGGKQRPPAEDIRTQQASYERRHQDTEERRQPTAQTKSEEPAEIAIGHDQRRLWKLAQNCRTRCDLCLKSVRFAKLPR